MSDYLIRQIGSAPNVDVRYRVQVADGTGTGTGHLQSLVLQDTASGARRSVPADALFVLIGAQPRTQWLGDRVARDRRGFILTGPDLPAGTRWPPGRPPLPLETSLPGLFAAGDVRRGIGQPGRLRSRRRRGHHPPGTPLPSPAASPPRAGNPFRARRRKRTPRHAGQLRTLSRPSPIAVPSPIAHLI